MFRILVVEDEKELQELYCTVLSENGYEPVPASDGENALQILEKTYIDLIISDVTMPRMDGFEMTRILRESHYTLPILMITARGSMADKQTGFHLGADDYMVKPINLNEMLWRISALLRRSQSNSERKIRIGSTLLDYDTLTVTDPERQTLLPQKEFLLLFKLLSSINRVFTRVQIMDEIWGMDSDTDPHTLEVHISRLRERFKDNPDFKIITIRGLGYKAVEKENKSGIVPPFISWYNSTS